MANKIAYHSVVIDTNGKGRQATITVYNAGTLNVATIYSNQAGAAQGNPFNTDATGRFVFYSDPGEYDIKAAGIGLTTYILSNVSIIGEFSRFVISDPTSGQYRVKKIRRDAGGNILITYNDTPEA